MLEDEMGMKIIEDIMALDRESNYYFVSVTVVVATRSMAGPFKII
jgi:hypothetical protein